MIGWRQWQLSQAETRRRKVRVRLCGSLGRFVFRLECFSSGKRSEAAPVAAGQYARSALIVLLFLLCVVSTSTDDGVGTRVVQQAPVGARSCVAPGVYYSYHLPMSCAPPHHIAQLPAPPAQVFVPYHLKLQHAANSYIALLK